MRLWSLPRHAPDTRDTGTRFFTGRRALSPWELTDLLAYLESL